MDPSRDPLADLVDQAVHSVPRMNRTQRLLTASNTPTPLELASAREEHREPPPAVSPTELASEAAQTGLEDVEPADDEPLPGESSLQAGDPDVDPLDNEYTGDDIPGGATPTPDQNDVDEVGRAYGLPDTADGLVSTEEQVSRRDQARWELDPRSKDRES